MIYKEQFGDTIRKLCRSRSLRIFQFADVNILLTLMAWEHHEFLLSMMLFRHTPGDEIICHCFLCKLVRLNLCELKRACHKELSIASTATLIIVGK